MTLQYAVTMGMPIMSAEWVERLWEERYNLDITANSESMVSIVFSFFVILQYC